MEAHSEGIQYAYDRVKQALHLHSDRRQRAARGRDGVIMNKGLTVRTAQQPGQRYMPRMLEHVQKGELDPSFLASHRMPLEEAPSGYAMFKEKSDGCIRAVFAP